MTANILDGKAVAAKQRQKSAARAAEFTQKFGRAPGLAVVKVGDDPASAVYVRNKRKACEECGIASFAHDLPATTTRAESIRGRSLPAPRRRVSHRRCGKACGKPVGNPCRGRIPQAPVHLAQRVVQSG